MSTVGYDLDSSGGLMPLIKALIKPPDEDLNVQKPKKPQHPYYKRPGKGHNHDSCDACGEGGDLICCDRCPASFHLGCYDPPLDENDIPAGLWLCRECSASDDRPASTRSSRAQSPADYKSDTEKKSRALRASSTSSSSKRKIKDDNTESEEKKETEVKKQLTPMEVLVRAAKVMNPKQFDLPDEMKIPRIFPGTDKNEGGGPSTVTTDAWGCVPLPARSCYVCRATCKLAPLVQCDYCPLLYHQDCLDPPLTSLPTGRWMCPNHVEQFIDWKLVNSISATERVALWDKFSGPVDQHAIKVDFIRRARRNRPSFRVKVACGARGRVAVPRMVRAHYRRPPPLLPSRREHVRCVNVMRNLKSSGAYEGYAEEDDKRHRICMNLTCAEYEGAGAAACPLRPAELRAASADDADDDLKAIGEHALKDEDQSDASSDSEMERLSRVLKRRQVRGATACGGARRGERRPERLTLRDGDDVAELLTAVELQLDKLDERLIKLLAWQRLQQVAAGEQAAGRWAAGGAAACGERAARALRHVDRAQLARLGLRAAPLPSQLLARADRERIAALVWGAPPEPLSTRPAPPEHALAQRLIRAAITQLLPDGGDGEMRLGRAYPMRLSSLTVGCDSGCGVQLDARCRRVSRTHAIIFCDEVTGHFELLNYSEWGTRVNGVLYACDLSEPQPDDDGDQSVRPLRKLLAHAPAPPRVNGCLTAGRPLAEWCQCREGAAARTAAWEGSALLPHGALVEFGCTRYVFSITDQAPESPVDQ